MKRLGLLRHAKSDWDDMALRDFDRGLNNRGRKGAALMGEHIADFGGAWQMIIASPAERVRRTLEASGLDLPITLDERAYLGDSDMLLKLLGAHAGSADAVLLAAHNPGLQELAVELVTKSDNDLADADTLVSEVVAKFPTASFAVLELDIDDWADCKRGCGKLVHFARPRDLDPELGPEG